MRRHAKASSSGSNTRLGAIIRGAFATRGAFGRGDGSGAPAVKRRSLAAALALTATLVVGVAVANAATAPTVTIESPSLISANDGSFAFAGHVNPGGTEAEYETEWHFDCSPSCGSPAGGTIAPDESNHLVEAEVTGLAPKTTYTVTLHAGNAGGETTAEKTFKTPAGPPTAETATTLTNLDRSIGLRGFVNPRDSQATDCHFAYGTDENYGHSAPCLGLDEVQTFFIGSNVTTGQFKLSSESQATPDLPFTASAAEVQDALEALASIGAGNVSVILKVNVSGARTYRIAFQGALAEQNLSQIELLPGTTPLNGGSNASTATQGGSVLEILGSGGSPVEARATLSVASLTPGATYHFQLLTTTAGGTAHSADATFAAMADAAESCSNEVIRTEQHSTSLPDCRAYEQVSPVDKGGNDVMPFSPRTRASVDGEAVQFASLGGFGDVHGAGIAFEYLAQRGGAGWSTHAITPTAASSSVDVRSANSEALYAGELSPDLNRGVFAAPKALAGTPGSVSGVPNLYLRDDLGTPGDGTYHLLTTCPFCEEHHEELPPASSISAILQRFVPAFSGASPDMEHVAFESVQRLTGEPRAQSPFCGSETVFFPLGGYFCASRLYEYDHGTLRLAGVLPDGEPADASFAGTSAGTYTPHVVSDGSDGHTRIEFTQPTTNEGATYAQFQDEEDLFGMFSINSGVQTGNLFQRIDGTETIQLNASERTKGEPSAFAPAQYLDASPDGEHVFFSTGQALTDDAQPGPTAIYVYDASKPASAPDNLTLVSAPGAAGEGMLGTGGDGHYAYYMTGGRIVNWHDGVTRDIAQIPQVLANELKTDGVQYGITLRQSRVTPDGRHLIFTNDRSPVPGGYDHGPCNGGFGCREVYVYSADTGQLACASCNPSGAEATGDAEAVSENFHGGAEGTSHENRVVSADGRYVFFSSPEALVPRDTNGKYDAYEYDSVTGEVSLLSSGTDKNDSYFVEAGEDGRDVFIDTREPLVGHDTDSAYDLYDVRLGGGYSEPVPVPASCQGETCQGAQSAPPPTAAVGSGIEGPGDPKQPRCPKGRHPRKVRGKTRCVKPRKHHRTANTNRRAGR